MKNSSRKNIRKKISDFLVRLTPAMTTAMVVCAMAMPVLSAAAEGEDNGAKAIMKTIIGAIFAVAIVAGVITGALGIVAYGEAKSEGAGPEMAKAKNQIVGAIILLALGVAGSTLKTTLVSALEKAFVGVTE